MHSLHRYALFHFTTQFLRPIFMTHKSSCKRSELYLITLMSNILTQFKWIMKIWYVEMYLSYNWHFYSCLKMKGKKSSIIIIFVWQTLWDTMVNYCLGSYICKYFTQLHRTLEWNEYTIMIIVRSFVGLAIIIYKDDFISLFIFCVLLITDMLLKRQRNKLSITIYFYKRYAC